MFGDVLTEPVGVEGTNPTEVPTGRPRTRAAHSATPTNMFFREDGRLYRLSAPPCSPATRSADESIATWYSREVKREHGLMLGLLLVGCSATDPAPDSARPGGETADVTVSAAATGMSTAADMTVSAAATGVSEAAAAIEAFSIESELVGASFAEIHRLAELRPDELREAALDQLEAGDTAARYPALYALALTVEGTEATDALRAVLDSPDINERMLAAGSLIAQGEKAAFPILIELLGSDEQLALRDPPQQAWQFARFLLIQYTDEDMGLLGPSTYGPDQAAVAQQAWQDWWASTGASLQFDAATQVYR